MSLQLIGECSSTLYVGLAHVVQSNNTKFKPLLLPSQIYVTGLSKNSLIAGLTKIDFFPEMASTKSRYCLSKI